MLPFPQDFATTFATATRGQPSHELPLLRALQSTIDTLSTRFRIENIHGAKSRVTFTPTAMWRPGAGRCELADLMILTFQRNPVQRLRLTFLQAKSERAFVQPPCSGALSSFWANYEQWDLLSRRLPITPVGTVKPPRNVLSDAILSSVGSFGFFYKDSQGDYQICYSAADNLRPVLPNPRHYGRLELVSVPQVRTVSGYRESVAACCSLIFAQDIEAGLIGTPIERSTATDEVYRRHVRSWVGSVLTHAVSHSGSSPDDSVAGRILRALADDVGSADPTPAPVNSLILIETDADQVLRR